tara:strand:- start:900 stop:1709 length:810 start_codon:yes stop_codon:yes gene_type:complete
MSWGAIVVGVIGTGVSYLQSEKNRNMAEGMSEDALKAQKKAQAQLDKEKAAYRNMQIKNSYADMENPYEDITVNQQQAQFQAQQMDAQRANIMRGFRGAAGASGIASLAQAMANQGQLQTQRISASIGQQEARNQALLAKGAAAADMAERGGEQWVQAAEMDRTATLLGTAYGEATGANMAVQTAKTNEMNAALAQQQITADMFGTVAQGLASSKTIGGDDNNIFTGNQNKAFEKWSEASRDPNTGLPGTREQFDQWKEENPDWRKTLR